MVIQTIRNSLSKSDQLVFPCPLYQDKKKKSNNFSQEQRVTKESGLYGYRVTQDFRGMLAVVKCLQT